MNAEIVDTLETAYPNETKASRLFKRQQEIYERWSTESDEAQKKRLWDELIVTKKKTEAELEREWSQRVFTDEDRKTMETIFREMNNPQTDE